MVCLPSRPVSVYTKVPEYLRNAKQQGAFMIAVAGNQSAFDIGLVGASGMDEPLISGKLYYRHGMIRLTRQDLFYAQALASLPFCEPFLAMKR